jgi:exodeoxyribonuclease-3
MKLISFNVNGIRASVTKGLIDTINQLNPDIMGFQETKATPDQVKGALADLKGYHIIADGAERPGYSGTAIISKQQPISVVMGIGNKEFDNEGRTITAEFDQFYFVNCYQPNSGQELVRLDYRVSWDIAMKKHLSALSKKKPIIFCGDLNVAHQPIDIARPKSNYNKTSGYTQKEIDGMTALLGSGLKDTFRELYPDTVKYSWWSVRLGARAKNIGWRIDYFLVSPDLLPKVKEAFILNDVMGSDHCPVGIEVKI